MTSLKNQIGGAIQKVKAGVQRSRDSILPPVMAERDRLLSKLGEQTQQLIDSGTIPVGSKLRPTVERLAALWSKHESVRPGEGTPRGASRASEFEASVPKTSERSVVAAQAKSSSAKDRPGPSGRKPKKSASKPVRAKAKAKAKNAESKTAPSKAASQSTSARKPKPSARAKKDAQKTGAKPASDDRAIRTTKRPEN